MMKLNLVRATLAALLLSILPAASQAGTATFGSGANTFTMDFTTIGNPGNAADIYQLGSVEYTYQIGTYEVSEDMITKYNATFGTANSLEISLYDKTDSGGNSPNKPATGVTWNEAARFVNWLNTSTGGHAAYKFTTNGVNDDIAQWNSGDTGYDPSNYYRNSLAKYVLPSSNEWYKAAYYDPNKNGGAGGYWEFPTGNDSAPTPVASGTTAGTAVYGQNFSQGPADVTQAGGLSPYGAMGLGGNVYEWDEDGGEAYRSFRSGWWISSSNANELRRVFAAYVPPNSQDEHPGFGFRVASLELSAEVVPEPSMMVIGTLFGLGGLIARRRMKK
jgi:formylglycine-generating enzyme